MVQVYSKVKLEKAILWCEVAKEDLVVSKLLFEKKHYNYSIYWLQQAIEKALKSTIIPSNSEKKVSDEKLMQQISHKTYEHIVDQFFKQTNLTNVQDALDFFSELKMISKKRYDQITGEDYELVLSQMEMISQEQDSIDILEKKKMLMGAGQLFIDEWLQFAEKNYSHRPDIIERAKNDMKIKTEFLTSFREMAIGRVIIIYLAALTQPHMSCTRYPYILSSPLEFYNEDNYLVKNYWIFYEAASNGITSLLKNHKAYLDLVLLCHPEL